MPGQGILIKIQCTVTNRSEQSLISTRVRRGLVLITPYLQGTIKWIDKCFKRGVNFFLAFGQEWFCFIYSFKRDWMLLMTVLFPTEILSASTRGHLSWLGGWLRGCIHSCVCQQRHTLQHVPPPIEDTARERYSDPSHRNSSFPEHTVGDQIVHCNVWCAVVTMQKDCCFSFGQTYQEKII